MKIKPLVPGKVSEYDEVSLVFKAETLTAEYAGCGSHALEVTVVVTRAETHRLVDALSACLMLPAEPTE